MNLPILGSTPTYLTLTPDSNSSLLLSALFILLTASLYSVTRCSAQRHPPSVIAAICKNTLNCGVRPR